MTMSGASVSIRVRIPAELAEERPLPWALSRLRDALSERGATMTDGPADIVVGIAREEGATDGAFSFQPTPDGLVIRGAASGLAYGITEIADRVRWGDEVATVLRAVQAGEFSPATPVRSVLRAFVSDAFDLDWYRDPEFWTSYLDHLAENRINRVQLSLGMAYNYSHDQGVYDNYLHFAYPFLVQVPGRDVRATGVDAEEQAKNIEALRVASSSAAERGIEFFLGLWNHAVQPELETNPNLRYPITGLAQEDAAEYAAEALSAILEDCPGIAGVTFRVHYEGGVHEADRTSFWTTVFRGIAACGRPVKLDMHAKGVDAELLDAAHGVVDDVTLSAKYWAEHQGLPYHQARVRDLERARPADTGALSGVTQNTRRFTRYGYGDFLTTERDTGLIFRIWPGTQRFLLWADPKLFAGYGRQATIGGAQGIELCEPLTFRGRKNSGQGPRDLYIDPDLHQSSSDDWRKYEYTYRLWGRLLYNPDADPEEWRRYLRATVGEAAEFALSAASRILPLTTVSLGLSASCNYYWPEVNTNLPLLAKPDNCYAFDTPEPFDWAAVSPFDPELFGTTRQYVTGLLADAPSEKFAPIWVAESLEGLIDTANAAADGVTGRDPRQRRIAIDVAIVTRIGRMFASRLRAGVQFDFFERTADQGRLAAALAHLERARDALAEVVRIADGVYFRDLAFGDRPTERGHWRDRLVQLDDELTELRALLTDTDVEIAADPISVAVPTGGIYLSEAVVSGAFRLDVRGLPGGSELTFHTRPLNQGAEWEAIDVAVAADGTACFDVPLKIAAAYPLQWYATARMLGHAPINLPVLGDDLCGMPYRVVSAL